LTVTREATLKNRANVSPSAVARAARVTGHLPGPTLNGS